MDLAAAALAGAGVSAAAAAGAAGLVVWAGPLDKPRARGSHTTPTVTSGGLAIVMATALGLLAAAFLNDAVRIDLSRTALTLAFAGGLGMVGAVDDLVDLGAKIKLALQVLAALIFAGAVAHMDALPLAPGITLSLSPLVGILGVALWLVLAANAVNFMDGANGLAPGCVAIALLALAAGCFLSGQPGVGACALAAAAAGLGFLPWNLPTGRLFQGDVGALFSGSLAAALAVLAATGQPEHALSPYLMPMALTPLLTDVLLTLGLRARRGERLMDAHRDHLYQQWLITTGKPHSALAWRAWLITSLYGVAAVACEAAPAGWRPILFIGGVILCAAGWAAARRRLSPP